MRNAPPLPLRSFATDLYSESDLCAGSLPAKQLGLAIAASKCFSVERSSSAEAIRSPPAFDELISVFYEMCIIRGLKSCDMIPRTCGCVPKKIQNIPKYHNIQNLQNINYGFHINNKINVCFLFCFLMFILCFENLFFVRMYFGSFGVVCTINCYF